MWALLAENEKKAEQMAEQVTDQRQQLHQMQQRHEELQAELGQAEQRKREWFEQKEKLQRGVEGYSEAQGKGFVCWRFIRAFAGGGT